MGFVSARCRPFWLKPRYADTMQISWDLMWGTALCWGDMDSFVFRLDISWWRHQMETYSALLALCVGNSPVTCEFPSQRPVMRSFEGFFYLRVNKRLSKQSLGWWFETQLWRHSNEICWHNADFLGCYVGDSLVLTRYGFLCISVGYIEHNNKPINHGWQWIFPKDIWGYETPLL